MAPPIHRNAPAASAAEAAPVATPSIICGTDFSENSAMAVEVAALLARRLAEPLVLVHAISEALHEPLPPDLREALGFFERAQLYEELEEARARGVQVTEVLESGPPDAVLRGAAERHRGRLLVVASHRKNRRSRWPLGGVAERVAESAPLPTLIVRQAAPFASGLAGKRPLRVFLGADFTPPSAAALLWVSWLRQQAACEITVALCEPENSVLEAFHFAPPPSVRRMADRADRIRSRLFREHVQALLGPDPPPPSRPVRIRLEPGWGRSDAHLIHAAEQAQADLIVVGSHQRRGWDRVGHHSVSRGVLHYARTNVVCVPCSAQPEAGS